MTSTKLIRCSAIVLAAFTCGSALAGDDAPPRKVVAYPDLNLNSTAGVATLYRRIERAAAEVCNLPHNARQLKLAHEIKACRNEAVDRAVREANLSALSELHLARTGRKPPAQQYADRR